ncbi:MAG: thioredoxin domain-containing protein [Myxococcales bacterium]|nr:thioredoxin domain-containing protein [Myxococcales bacterium]
MKRVVALLFTLALPAAAGAAEKCPLPPAQKPGAVVARIGKTTVKLSELDAKLADDLCRLRVELAQKEADLRQRGLDQMVAERLIEAEAKKRGLADPEALIKAEVVDATPAPGDEEKRAFYAANQGQMGGATYEQIGPRIGEHLHQQARQARFDALVRRLRDEAKVETLLEPYRLPVAATGPARGPADAPITVVGFADYECPYCARAAESLAEAAAKFPGKVRIVFRDFPLDFHPNAVPAAIAARCAGAQGKYWEMHDLLFANQRALDATALRGHATALGLDGTKFEACMRDPAQIAAVAADEAAGKKLGVEGTPAYFVNGIPLSGAQPVEAFVTVFEQELARKGKK